MKRWLKMELRTSPHFRRGRDVDTVMRHVIWALLPALCMGWFAFGLGALLLSLACVLGACLTEAFLNRRRRVEGTLADGSAVLTGLLLAMTLPPGFPLWMAFLGSVIAIGLGKGLFGGLGHNVFNPALVGRAFLQAAFPAAITTWTPALSPERFSELPAGTLGLPFLRPPVESVTAATPLASLKFDGLDTPLTQLFAGTSAGSMGETGALLLLAGGLYLALRGFLDWRIPVGILATVALLSGLLHALDPQMPSALFMLGSGGLMLGAVFMATDMVTSPVTPKGTWLYACAIGALVVVIRVWGGLPEGVMYAILLGNAMTPLLNRATQPRIYGEVRS